ncbi:2-octaprenyl-6-methoxyphenyl hydroxylase [Marinimicrobium agarilyticum]|uniref:2-octaprenyl-6-methoxyphenyl hydroxylase n=1 Tax=Marinimicrobium agarilyticum TaxID=306546 RepID=UPI0004224AA1|nr:2-octaprenyl-6-methoxyphenyl hydroxylase [Marinimicrobium agarilyticum]
MNDIMAQPAVDYDIAIIGGGMVGALLARLLASGEAGWRVAVIDASELSEEASAHYQSEYDNRSTALSAGTVELFQRQGLWQRIGQHATAIREVLVSDRGHLGGARLSAQERGRSALGYVVENAWLAPCLREAAQADVHWLAPVRVEKIAPGPHSMTLSLAGESAPPAISCRLAVLADGGLSGLHRQLGIEQQRRDYDQQAIIANVSFERPHQGHAFERFTPLGPLALLPLDERPEARRAALVWTLPPERAEAMMVAPEAEVLAQLQRAFGWRLGRLTRVGQRQSWRLALVEASEQVRSRLVLLGNSAHYLHPVAGQGFNLSVRDTAALASLLNRAYREARDPGELVLLNQYWRKRQWDQTLTTEMSDRLVRMFSNRRPGWMALRHLGFLGLDWVPGAKAGFATQTMGLASGRSGAGLISLETNE